MAIEFFDGFEAGFDQTYWTSTTNMGTTAPGRFAGTYAMKNIATSTGTATVTLPPSVKKTVGFAYRPDWHDAASGQFFPSFLSGGVNHLCLTFTTSGQIILRRGASTGTVITTSSMSIAAQQWCFIEMQATIHDTTGMCIVKVDGIEFINYVGDTRNAGTTTDIDQIVFATRGANAVMPYIDDFYVCNDTNDTANTGRPDNTFLGDIKVTPLFPNGNGASSQWVGSDTDSIDNYLLVDESPPNTTDYVSSGTNGDRDMWTFADVNPVGIVYAVKPAVYASKSDAGLAGLKILQRDSGGSIIASSDKPLGTSWGWQYGTHQTTKSGGGAWSTTEINAMQFGVEKT